jgi:KilA-N domain
MANKNLIITVEGTEIRTYNAGESDFISLTDIAKRFNERTDQVILNWLRTRSTVEFLGAWEILYNPLFNPLNFEGIKNQTGSATFVLTVKDWVETTAAIGINAKTGRYGGTFAHRDIAYEFLSYLNPTFKLYVIKEFQRLKTEEFQQNTINLEWNLRRTLAKINYKVHTDAVKSYLIPPKVSETGAEGLYYASEADILNVALFGITSKQWKESNPDVKGNVRDYATTEQLLILSNLENINAELIKLGLDKKERLKRLNDTAIHQMNLFSNVSSFKLLGDGDKSVE